MTDTTAPVPGPAATAPVPAPPAAPEGQQPLAQPPVAHPAPLGSVPQRRPVRWWIPVVATLSGLLLLGTGMVVGVGIGLALGDRGVVVGDDRGTRAERLDGIGDRFGDRPGDGTRGRDGD